MSQHLLVDDMVRIRLPVQHVEQVVRYGSGHAVERFFCHARHVRRRQDIGQRGQGIVRRDRFAVEHVQARAPDDAGRQRLVQRRLVDDAAACCVDQK